MTLAGGWPGPPACLPSKRGISATPGVYGDRPPELGGNLAGRFSPDTQESVFRLATSVSSLLTGMVVGLISGLLVLLVRRLSGLNPRRPRAR